METTIEIIGVNGDTAVIAGPRAGDAGVFLAPDMSGFMDPEVDMVSESPANLPGARYVSHRIQPRRVTFAVDIVNGGAGSSSWQSRDSRWRKLWAHDRPTRIEATTVDGTRTLSAYLEKIEVDFRYDPGVLSENRVVMTVVAFDPFWWGTEEVFETSLLPGSGFIDVLEANPTDQPVWPVWVVEAPGSWVLPDYSFKDDGLAGRMVELPVLDPGEHTVVNTDPSQRQLTSVSGSQVWARMGGRRFRHPIPAYTGAVRFHVELSGGASERFVQLRLRRPFTRPWGML